MIYFVVVILKSCTCQIVVNRKMPRLIYEHRVTTFVPYYECWFVAYHAHVSHESNAIGFFFFFYLLTHLDSS